VYFLYSQPKKIEKENSKDCTGNKKKKSGCLYYIDMETGLALAWLACI
jgi:hypothetical protein